MWFNNILRSVLYGRQLFKWYANVCSLVPLCLDFDLIHLLHEGTNCLEQGLVCDALRGVCVSCEIDSDCAPSGLPICSHGICRGCNSSSECRFYEESPVCYQEKCVACSASEQGPCRSDTTCDSICTGNNTCSAATLNCAAKGQYCSPIDEPAKCLACVQDRQCRNDTHCDSTCATDGSSCHLGAQNCLASFQRCNTISGQCSCGSDAACVTVFPDRPFCAKEPLTNVSRCVSCTTDAMCRSQTDCSAYCDLNLGHCVASNSSNCTARNDSRHMCDFERGQCVQCLFDDPDTCPRCNNGTCERCEHDTDCRTENQCDATCDTKTGLCINTNHLDCETIAVKDPRHFLPKCNKRLGECAQCIQGNDILCTDPTPVCDYLTSKCVQCLEVSDCEYAGHCSAACTDQTCIYDKPMNSSNNFTPSYNISIAPNDNRTPNASSPATLNVWNRCNSSLVCNLDDLKCVQCTEDWHCAIPGSHRVNVRSCNIATHQCQLAGWFIGVVAGCTVGVVIFALIGLVVFLQRRMVKSRISRAFSTNLTSIYEPSNTDGF
jgi:hypothetical protein